MESIKEVSLAIRCALILVIISCVVASALAESEKETTIHSNVKDQIAISAFTRKTLLKQVFLPQENPADDYKRCRHLSESCSGDQSCCNGCLCFRVTLKCMGNC